MGMGIFETVSDDTIKRGDCTDIYFVRTEETLEKEGINPLVSMEVTAAALPYPWGVVCGLSDVLVLLYGLPVTVDAGGPQNENFHPRHVVPPKDRHARSKSAMDSCASVRPPA